MIQCSSCGKVLDKVPVWLASAKADFVCNNCPNRQTKNIAFMTLESEAPKAKAEDEPIEEVTEDEEDTD
jgi:hypothetical protein